MSHALDYLTPSEEAELDEHLAALAGGVDPHTAYQERPVEWIVEQLGIERNTLVWSSNPGYKKHKWDGTKDPLVAMLEGLALWEDVGVEAATGTQKSHTAACAILWFLACWRNARVFTYAPKEDQLRLYIWAEIAELWPRFRRLFPTAELTDLRIRMDGTDKWAAFGVAVGLRAGEDSATKAQGGHAPDMLIVTEETPGIDPAIMTALRNTRTGVHNLQLALGNPDNQADTLHQFCILEGVRRIRISAYDHPNVVTRTDVVPGAASPAGIRRIAAKDPPGSPMYESRVRGISPTEATDALIKLAWCTAAAAKWKDAIANGGARALGVDVANSDNGDLAAKAYFLGAALEKVKAKPCPNSNDLGAKIVLEARDELGIAQEHVGVDPVGVGAGTVNEMLRHDFHVRRLFGSAAPIDSAARAPDGSSMDFAPDANRFLNLRAQMGWQLREDLRTGQLALPDDPKLFRQLTAITYEVRNGKVVLEDKKHLIQRLGESPNEFDAVMYGNWVRPRSTPIADDEYGDDEHPGFDYKARRRRPRRKEITETGEAIATVLDEDLRPDRYGLPGFTPFRMPRMFGAEDDE